TTIQSVS
ncbi:rho termination factor, N-terminal domain protein, partial [Vibrio parahaemolyticus V-223/04]